MSHATLDIPVFDADNHLYETRDALTKFLPDRYKQRHRLRRRARPHEDRHPGPASASTSRTRRSTSWPGPARMEDYFRNGNPDGKSRREIFGEPMRAIPAFREPAARVELMDEQGIDRALMFPTLASLIEERMRDDPELIHAVIHALNEWMHETWTFDYEDRIFATPVITLPIVEKAIEELEWVVERGARVVLIRPAPVPGFRGPRSFGLPEFDPFWEKVVEHDVLVAMHSSDSGYERYANDWMGSDSEMLPFQPQAFRMLSAVAADRGRGGRARLPRRAVPLPAAQGGGHRERQQLGRAAARRTWPTSTRRCRRTSPRTRSTVIKRNIYISPFWEEDLGALAELIGVEHVLFGSDFPHPEGLADPASYVEELEGLPEDDGPQDHGRQPRPPDERRGRRSCDDRAGSGWRPSRR